VVDPRTGRYKCYGGGWDAGSQWIYDYSAYTYYGYSGETSNVTPTSTRVAYDYDGSIAASGLLPDRNNGADDPADLRVPEGWYVLPAGALGEIFRPTIGDYEQSQPIISERERVTLFVNGEFEINEDTTLYAEALFNRRESFHEQYDQLWTYNYTSNYGLQIFDGSCFGYACWGYDYDDNGELIYSYDYSYYYVDVGAGDPQSVGWTGASLLDPVIAYPAGGAETKVDYTRFVVGATGDVGKSNWTWDVSYQYSKSDGWYLDNLVYDDARWASMNKMPYWGGSHIGSCDGTTFDRYGPDVEFIVVNGANVPVGTIREADIPCIDIDALDPRVVAGDLTDEERDFLYGQEEGTTIYDNQSFDIGFANTEVFEWYAGTIGLAAGMQFMIDEIADTPGIESRSGNAWDGQTVGRGSAKVFGTYGETDTTAAYVETRVPLLGGKPGFDYLELAASARWTEVAIEATEDSDARDFSDITYKIGLDWRVNDLIRFRANRGTSFRTPALFELYRKNFHTFPSPRSVDPCWQWGSRLENNEITQMIADNCAAEGLPDNLRSTIGPDVTTGGGAAVLDPETSESNTIGVVFTAREADFRMSIDYWDLEVKDQIGTFAARDIVYGCYGSDTFPNDQLCSLFTRDQSGNPIENLRVDSVQSSYINLDLQRTAGWDIQADYRMELPRDMALTIRTAHTITTTKETESAIGEITSRKGWAGNPEWVGNLTFRLDKGPWAASWRTTYFDSTDNWRPGVARSNSWIGLSGEEETFYYKLTLDSRFYHNASVNYTWGEGWQANLSITNITDELPPRASQRAGINIQGYGAFHSQYDWKGRRYGLNIKKTF
jgi:iron complex outermembrane receptor protein